MNIQDSFSPELRRQLVVYRGIIEAGCNFSWVPPLRPTLIIEAQGEISVAVLDPPPEMDEVFEVVMQWKQAVLDDREEIPPHCVGFVSRPGEMTLGVFPPTNGTWFSGHIDSAAGKIEWTLNDEAK